MTVAAKGCDTRIGVGQYKVRPWRFVVLTGVATALVGVITFKLQVNLPYKKILIFTGVLIGGVLLVMVGNTVHVMQVVGWLPIHGIGNITLPYWLGTWFGLYATREGIGLQVAAAAFVIGSYVLAEWRIHRGTPSTAGLQRAIDPVHPSSSGR